MSNLSIIETTVKMTINTPKYYHTFQNIQRMLIKITIPYMFIIGCIGLITNTSTIALLSKSFLTKNLRHKWALIALAVSDLVLNVALLIRVFHDITRGHSQYVCITISFLSQLAELLSACFTVLFTIQRYTAVRYPIQAAIQKRSSPILFILFIFTLSIAFCFALTYNNTYIDCHEELKLRWFIADALLSFVIPFSLILIFNILIVNLIREHGRSSITVQSTLSRNDKRDKRTRRHRLDNKLDQQQESYLMNCSYAYLFTSQVALSELDIDKNSHSTRQQIPLLSYNNSDEMEFLTNGTDIPMTPIGVMITDATPNAHTQSTKLQSSADATIQHSTSSNSRESRELAYTSSDPDCVNTREGQTTQSIRVTRMLVLVSSCFLILNAPVHICLLVLKIRTSIDAHVYSQHTELERFQQTTNLTANELRKFVYIQTNNNNNNNNNTILEETHSLLDEFEIVDDQIGIHLLYIAIFFTQLISYASYSINFFLYSFSGVTFRTELRQFFNKLRKH